MRELHLPKIQNDIIHPSNIDLEKHLVFLPETEDNEIYILIKSDDHFHWLSPSKGHYNRRFSTAEAAIISVGSDRVKIIEV